MELAYLEQVGPAGSTAELSYSPGARADAAPSGQEISERLLNGLRLVAGRARLKPRQCLELVSEELCPGRLLVLDSAWSAADQARGFEHGDQLLSCSGS